MAATKIFRTYWPSLFESLVVSRDNFYNKKMHNIHTKYRIGTSVRMDQISA
jgi:hypothetical protein